jgi:predicted transcriptional regulator
MNIVVKDPLGYKLKGLSEMSRVLGVTQYRARKQTLELLNDGIINKWGNSYYLTEKGVTEWLRKSVNQNQKLGLD